jgi:hypothetical protein
LAKSRNNTALLIFLAFAAVIVLVNGVLPAWCCSIVSGTGHNFRRCGVLKLAAGATGSTKLPFTGLHGAIGIAVDAAGNINVLTGSRLLKQPPE